MTLWRQEWNGGLGRWGGRLAAAMENLDGFPMETIIGGMSSTVTKVEKKAIPASEFEIPAGYTKVSPEELMGRQSK